MLQHGSVFGHHLGCMDFRNDLMVGIAYQKVTFPISKATLLYVVIRYCKWRVVRAISKLCFFRSCSNISIAEIYVLTDFSQITFQYELKSCNESFSFKQDYGLFFTYVTHRLVLYTNCIAFLWYLFKI